MTLPFTAEQFLAVFEAWNRAVEPFHAAGYVLGAALLAFAIYGLAGYALASSLAGFSYPRVPLFGSSPCPTVIFTLGLLLMARPPAKWALFVVPLVWSAIGASAAVLLDVPQDFALIVAGAGALVFLLARLLPAPGTQAH